jgi:hypothetical protein
MLRRSQLAKRTRAADDDTHNTERLRKAQRTSCPIDGCTETADAASGPFCSFSHAAIGRAARTAHSPGLAAAVVAAQTPPPPPAVDEPDKDTPPAPSLRDEPSCEPPYFEPISDDSDSDTEILPQAPPLAVSSDDDISDDTEAPSPPSQLEVLATELHHSQLHYAGDPAPDALPRTPSSSSLSSMSSLSGDDENTLNAGDDVNAAVAVDAANDAQMVAASVAVAEAKLPSVDVLAIKRHGIVAVFSSGVDPSSAMMRCVLKHGLLEKTTTTVRPTPSARSYLARDGETMLYDVYSFIHRKRPLLPSPVIESVAELLFTEASQRGLTVNVHRKPLPQSTIRSSKTFAKVVKAFSWSRAQIEQMQATSGCFVPAGEDVLSYLDDGTAANAAFAAQQAALFKSNFHFHGES